MRRGAWHPYLRRDVRPAQGRTQLPRSTENEQAPASRAFRITVLVLLVAVAALAAPGGPAGSQLEAGAAPAMSDLVTRSASRPAFDPAPPDRGDLVALSAGVQHAQLSAIGSSFVGKPVAVYCGTTLGWGMADPASGRVVLDAQVVCDRLERFLAGTRPRLDCARARRCPARGYGFAALVLTHELVHQTEIYGEAQTECYGYQRTPEAIGLLGEKRPLYVAALVRFVTEQHRKQIRLATGVAGERYGDASRCRKDGRWDLSPGDGVWP